MENFDEEQSRHLISWTILSRPKEVGGLGMGNLKLKNVSLLAKWLWRFPLESEALWCRIIKAKYGLKQNNWDPAGHSASTCRCPWKSIFSVADQFCSSTKWVIGDGTIIQFWEDC